MKMYTNADMRAAQRRLDRCRLILIAGLTLLLAAYVAAVIVRSQILMLVIAQIIFFFAAIQAALWLRPALQYRNFLRDVQNGLRRGCICTTESLNPDVSRQDGARVQALQVRLDDGDTRIFYVNVSKTDLLPGYNSHIRLVSHGRHMVEWEEIAP